MVHAFILGKISPITLTVNMKADMYRVFRNKSIAQYLLLVNEAQAAVLVPQAPADSKQQQTRSSGEFVFLHLWYTHADSNLNSWK